MDGNGLNPDGYSLIEEILILGWVDGNALLDFLRIWILGVGGSTWRDGMLGIWTGSVDMYVTIDLSNLSKVGSICLL